jgi:hypothetical protein
MYHSKRMANRLRAGTIRGSNPGRVTRFSFSPKRPDLMWGPPTLLLNGQRGSFPRVKRPGNEIDQSPAPRAKVKEILSYLSPYCLFLSLYCF